MSGSRGGVLLISALLRCMQAGEPLHFSAWHAPRTPLQGIPHQDLGESLVSRTGVCCGWMWSASGLGGRKGL